MSVNNEKAPLLPAAPSLNAAQQEEAAYDYRPYDEDAYGYAGIEKFNVPGESGTQEAVDELRSAGLLSSIFNLSNAVLGGGVLAFPFAFAGAGIGGGAGLLVLMYFLALLGLKVLANVAVETNAESMQQIVADAFGRKAKLAVEILLIIYFGGACIAYLTILGDVTVPTLQHWVGVHWYSDEKFIKSVLVVAIVLPVAMIQKIKYLGWSSAIAVFAVLYTVGLVSYVGGVAVSGGHVSEATNFGLNVKLSFLSAFPIIAFAFQCHVSLIPVVRALENPSPTRVNLVLLVSMTLCVVLYGLCGAMGYLYHVHPESDILKCIPLTAISGIARVAMGLTAIFSYPMSSFNARLAIVTVAGNIPRIPKPWPTWLTIVVTTAWVGLTLLVALFVDSIDDVFSYIGAIGASMFIFIVPGFLLYTRNRQSLLIRVGAIALMTFAIVLGLASVGVKTYNLIKGGSEGNCALGPNNDLARHALALY